MKLITEWNKDSTWWHWSYVLDWVVTLVVPAVVWPIFNTTRPFCRDWRANDSEISYPYAESETFPSWTLPLVALLLPMAVSALVALPLRHSRTGTNSGVIRHELHTLFLASVQAFLLAMTLTDPMKNYAGRLRPDYLSRLTREGFDINDSSPENLDAICGSKNRVVMDGRRSFPSGHSSYCFSGWTLTALIVASRLPTIRRASASFWRLLLVAVCYVLPAIVAISRTRDYRHNFSDILAGACLGVFTGYAVFILHYRSDLQEPLNRKTGRGMPAPDEKAVEGDATQASSTRAPYQPEDEEV